MIYDSPWKNAKNMMPPAKHSNVDKDLVLHHIDKLYSTQSQMWESMNRIVATIIILSLILIALSTGAVSIEDAVEVVGVKFKVSLVVLLSGGSFFITALCAAFFSQWTHSGHYGDEIKWLYNSLEYKRPSEAEPDTDAFEIPSFYMSIVAPGVKSKKSSNWFVRWHNFTVGLATLGGLLIIIPIGAQVGAGLRVVSLFGWRWWILIPYLLLPALTISLMFVSDYNND